MSQKFISLDDAATKLGVAKERLNQLREAGDLRAYRDGSSWKFRTEEIEKLESEGLPSGDPSDLSLDMGGLSLDDDPTDDNPPTPGPVPAETPAAETADTGDDDEDIGLGVEPLGDGDDAESILLTDDDAPNDGRPQSTIIGKNELSLESDLALAAGSDDAPIAADLSGPSLPDQAAAEESGELELELAEGSGVGSDIAGDSKEKSGLALDDEFELDLSGSSDSQSGAGSVAGLSGLDAIDLAADDDDDLVLGGSEGSDPAAGDSGVNLAPSDSGFSLDDVPPDLGGSAIGSALDLASISSASAASGMSLGGSAVSNEDFQLTPDEGGDEDEDSSQVVALEEVDGSEEEDMPGFEEIDDDDDFGEGGFGDGLGGGSAAGLSAEPAGMATVATQDVTFPGWILGFLGATAIVCLLCGFLAMELLRSMWTYEEPFGFSSGVMESLASLISG